MINGCFDGSCNVVIEKINYNILLNMSLNISIIFDFFSFCEIKLYQFSIKALQ